MNLHLFTKLLVFVLVLSTLTFSSLALPGETTSLLVENSEEQTSISNSENIQETEFESELFQNVVNTISPLITKLSLLVGGLFGIYFLLLIARVYYERKNVKLLQDIRFLLDQQNKKLRLPTSHVRRSIILKMFSWLGDKIKSLFFKVIKKKEVKNIKVS